jgi:hypothetical protein
MLVRVDDVRVWESVNARDYLIGDFGAVYLSGDLAYAGTYAYGDRLEYLQGVVDWVDGGWRVYPRNAGDVGSATTLNNPADALAPGDVILTEWFNTPTTPGCDFASGGFAELLNTTASDVDLDGLFVWDLLNSVYVQIRGAHVLPAGERAVVWAAGEGNCYGVPTEYPEGAPWPSGGWMSVYNQREVIDLAPLALWTLSQPGASMELSSGALNAADNDALGAWCVASSTFAGTDRGTPGAPASCP